MENTLKKDGGRTGDQKFLRNNVKNVKMSCTLPKITNQIIPKNRHKTEPNMVLKGFCPKQVRWG